MLAHYLLPGRTLPLSFVAPPNRDPPQERRAIRQRYDATAYKRQVPGHKADRYPLAVVEYLLHGNRACLLEYYPVASHPPENRVRESHASDTHSGRVRAIFIAAGGLCLGVTGVEWRHGTTHLAGRGADAVPARCTLLEYEGFGGAQP